MNNRTLTRLMYATAAAACIAVVTPLVASAADTKAAAAKPAAKATKAVKFVPPKLSTGVPDIGGTWTNASLTTLERPSTFKGLIMTPEELKKTEGDNTKLVDEGNAPTNPNFTVNDLPVNCGRGFSGTNCGYNSGWVDPGDTVMRVNGQPRSSFITSTPNGRIPPYKAGANVAAGRGGARLPAGGSVNDNPETKSLAEQCLTSFGNSAGPVMLPLLYNNNYKIVQSKDSVAIDVEMVHDARVIHLNAQHRTDGIRPWWGDSVGHYEGNTLVVETTNFPQRLAFRGSWQNLKVTEKFTRVAPDQLLYQFTVSDPTLWDTDWGGEYEFSKTKGELYEYACHEGNYALEGMLAGARDEDRQKAEAAAKARASATPAARAR